jgi:hypothetical protein
MARMDGGKDWVTDGKDIVGVGRKIHCGKGENGEKGEKECGMIGGESGNGREGRRRGKWKWKRGGRSICHR